MLENKVILKLANSTHKSDNNLYRLKYYLFNLKINNINIRHNRSEERNR